MSPARWLIAAAAAFAALAALVAAGALTAVDQWAVDHAMPGARLTGSKPTIAGALIPLWHVHWRGGLHVAAEIVTVPASLLPASVLVALCCLAIRGHRAAAWAAVYVVGNAVEALTKSTLTRPPLHTHALHIAAFDASYPSGHTIRAVLVAGAVSAAWPRARLPVIAWAAGAVTLLELGGLHVPSDIAGGLLLAGALLLAVARLR